MDEKEITLPNHLDWWDGPLNGTISYRGEVYWYDYYHFDRDESPYSYLDPEDRHYFYLVFPLTQREVEECEQRFAEVEEHRRRYREAWESGNVLSGDREWFGPDLGDRKPVGWFMDGANPKFYAIEIQRKTPGSESEVPHIPSTSDSSLTPGTPTRPALASRPETPNLQTA